MIPHNFSDRLLERVEQAVSEETGRLALGMAEDWSDYRERVGLIKGLKRLNDFMTELTEDRK